MLTGKLLENVVANKSGVLVVSNESYQIDANGNDRFNLVMTPSWTMNLTYVCLTRLCGNCRKYAEITLLGKFEFKKAQNSAVLLTVCFNKIYCLGRPNWQWVANAFQ